MSLPGLSSASSCLVESVTLAQSTRLLSSGGETTGFTVLVNWVDNPADAGITTDSLVLRVDEDDLEVLVGRVLVDPVGVENTQIGTSASNTLLSCGLEGSLILELVYSLVGWLSCVEVSTSFCSRNSSRNTYRRWHPLVLGACDLHDEHGHGR